MTRVLLAGLGEVGRKHLAVLRALPETRVVGVVEPDGVKGGSVPRGVPRFRCHERALGRTHPDLVVVATPPGVALRIAQDAASAKCRVLVEKPAAVFPETLRRIEHLARSGHMFVALQTHFAPGVAELLASRTFPPVARATVRLRCQRDDAYYAGWRARFATAGGVLHQQAIHGLALAVRMWPDGDVVQTIAVSTVNRRPWKEPGDQVHARVTFASGRELVVDARVDSRQLPHHAVELELASGDIATVSGRNLEHGVAINATPTRADAALPGANPRSRAPRALPPHGRPAPSQAQLRAAMYRALLTADRGGPFHPSLYHLSRLSSPLEVISRVYAAARDRDHRSGRTPSPAGV